MLVDREWRMGNGEWGMGSGKDQGAGEAGGEITNALFIPYLFPTPDSPFHNALIIGKKRGKLLTASIIEFDLLFNAHAYN